MKKNIILLPGASGNILFWNPLIKLLPNEYDKKVIAYPGFGQTPKNHEIHHFNNLQNYVLNKIQSESTIIAQSMGGIFAVAAAIQKPSLIKALVLIATSGGMDLTRFKAQDWRLEYQHQYPTYPQWFMQTSVNYETDFKNINIPILLIWGDHDPISPIEVGHYLNTCFPNAELCIVKGGKHDLAEQYSEEVAGYISHFLARSKL